MSGLAGVGAHVVRRRDIRAFQIADRVLSHLETSAISSDVGVTWRTPAEFLPETRRIRFPNGVVDLGLSHGVPGIIGMLAQFVVADLLPERSRRLLEGAVAWLMDAVPADTPRFGTTWPAADESRPIGWCYGDVGIAGVLLRVSRALGWGRMESEALGLLDKVRGPLERQRVPDAGFCHGAAGLAHIYNVAFQQTGDLTMRTQALHWFAEISRRNRTGTGIAGYEYWRIDDREPRWTTDTSLLSGAVGTALVLLAATEDREPVWQELFLL